MSLLVIEEQIEAECGQAAAADEIDEIVVHEVHCAPIQPERICPVEDADVDVQFLAPSEDPLEDTA